MKRSEFIKLSTLSISGMYFSNLFSKIKQKPIIEEQEQTTLDKHPIVIIGSGYGGAVAAHRLTQAGKKVLMLEMGLNWEKSGIPFSPMTKPGKSAAWLRDRTIAPFMNLFPLERFTGALDRLDYEHVKVWVGRGVGGGSLVNGGMAVLPKKEYFQEVFPELDVEKFYTRYFPLAQQELKVNLPSEEFLKNCSYYKFAQVGEEEAHKAGFVTTRVPNVYDFNYMEQEYAGKVPKSALAGEVIYGNNHGKNSLDKTYLKEALQTGNLEIWDLHQVVDITQLSSGGYQLNCHKINTEGRTVAQKQIQCEKLILAAGTMGTLELLFKSNYGCNLVLPSEVGEEWGNNGNFMTGRNWVRPFMGGTGNNQSTIPVSAIDNWDDKKHSFFTEIAPLPMGFDVATALYLMISPVKKKGTVGFDRFNQKITLNWNKSYTRKMKKNAKYFIRKMNRANGGTRSHLLFHNGYGHDICYHPLGGVVLGKATDAYGRLKFHDDLFVLDGSLIPGTIGVNPFLTITAIAEYCIENLIQQQAFG